MSGSIFLYLPKPAASVSERTNTSGCPLSQFYYSVSSFSTYRANTMEEKSFVFFLFSGTGFPFPLTFIISTGNANFTLHILTPLRKLYT